jgi:hypothetical protein
MRATVQITDCGVLSGFRRTGGRPIPRSTIGLLEARAMTAGPFDGTKVPRPQLSRVGVIAFWSDDEAIDRYEEELRHLHGITQPAGWTARLEPIRAVPSSGGHFYGVPADIPRSPSDDYHGPVVVITIAKTKRLRTVPFLRANAPADAAVTKADGFMWGSGFANLPQSVVATVSLWESGAAAHAYAVKAPGHRAAMSQEARKSFHHVNSFIRLRPYSVNGELAGRNPLDASVTNQIAAAITNAANQR